ARNQDGASEAQGRQRGEVTERINPHRDARMAKRTLRDRLFILWATLGLLGAAMAIYCNYKCPAFHHSERSFWSPDSEKQAKLDEIERWVSRLEFLANASLVYGAFGVAVFFRHGCVVFVIAAAVVVICEFACLDVTYIPL